jgi:hypothetical protein
MAVTTWQLKGFEDPATVQTFAMYETMNLAADCYFSSLIFYSDFFNFIRVLKKGIEKPLSLLGSVVDCIELAAF